MVQDRASGHQVMVESAEILINRNHALLAQAEAVRLRSEQIVAAAVASRLGGKRRPTQSQAILAVLPTNDELLREGIGK
jgi:hypothetical protein